MSAPTPALIDRTRALLARVESTAHQLAEDSRRRDAESARVAEVVAGRQLRPLLVYVRTRTRHVAAVWPEVAP